MGIPNCHKYTQKTMGEKFSIGHIGGNLKAGVVKGIRV